MHDGRFNIRCTISTNDMVLGAYPNGMAQPCVFAVMTDESPDERSVLYKWERWQVGWWRRLLVEDRE